MSTKKTIQLLLTENIDNLGIVGDVVDVKPGYARNYLVPHGLATTPTPAAIKAVEARRAEVERQLREQRAQQEALIGRLEGHEITLRRAANEEGQLYGSVSQADIAAELQEDGFNISEPDVRIGESIKHLDSYEIPIQIARDLKTEIKLWVVSDKPAEELMAEEIAPEDAENMEEAQTAEQPE